MSQGFCYGRDGQNLRLDVMDLLVISVSGALMIEEVGFLSYRRWLVHWLGVDRGYTVSVTSRLQQVLSILSSLVMVENHFLRVVYKLRLVEMGVMWTSEKFELWDSSAKT